MSTLEILGTVNSVILLGVVLPFIYFMYEQLFYKSGLFLKRRIGQRLGVTT